MNMKLAYFLIWLAGGGLVAISSYAFLRLLKVCEARHDAEHEEFFQFLLHPDTPYVSQRNHTRSQRAVPNLIDSLQETLSARSDAA
jgi:hypothetical protein